MRRGIWFVAFLSALPVMAGSLYVEGFAGGEGTTPNGWSSSHLAIHADPGSQDNRAFGLSASTRVRPVEPPGGVKQSEVAVYDAVVFPGDVALRISAKLLAEGRGTIALLLLDGSTREPVLTLERTTNLRIAGARGELVLEAPRGWAELAVELSPGVVTVGGPAGQLHLPVELPPSFVLAVRASGPEALIDDIRVETSDEGPLPSDRSPPIISVLADGAPLAASLLAGSPVEILIEIEDESLASYEATLDGSPFRSGIVDREGRHDLRVEASDEHGNRSAATFTFTLDLRPPEIRILERPPICTGGHGVVVRGSVADAHLETLELTTSSGQRPLQTDAGGIWEVRLDDLAEGPQAMNIRATDRLGRSTSAIVTTTVDRTPPAISILLDGAPAADGRVVNRPVAPFVTAEDTDSAARLSVRLDDAPWTEGGAISGEGVHLLRAEAIDCAGNTASRDLTFEIDTTPPIFESIDPSLGSELGETPLILRGRVSADATNVAIAGASVIPFDRSFEIPIAANEGENAFILRAVDRAGNEAELEHRFTVDTRAPSLEILERGSPLANGALFNRVVELAVRSSDPDATLAVELNGSLIEPATIISADGAHTVAASAVSALGHRASASRSFRIDTIPPAVAITSPQAGVVAADAILVRGTSDDAVSVNVAGISAAVAGGSFEATVPIDGDEQLVVAVGRDAAGNQGRDEVLLRRDALARGIIFTTPADGTITNRLSIRVAGRVLSPSLIEKVTVGATTVAVDPAGTFVLDAFALHEGVNAITATAVSTDGTSRAVTVNVIADRIPPRLRILESGAPMNDHARFPFAAALSIEASDESDLATTEVRIDGMPAEIPSMVTAVGGHHLAAVAMDAAGNETRVERTFFIGGVSGGGCRLERFLPASGSIVGSTVSGLTGRTGGAAGVKVNGIPATVSDGSFCSTVELPLEGVNEITIVCTDADGNVVGTPESITLLRATQLPSVTIDAPAEGVPTASELVNVSGIAGPGVVEVTVNGRAATVEEGDPNAARAWTVANVRLVSGVNVILAKARTASMKQATASRRILYLKDAPALTITSPLPGATAGNASISISGIYRNLDPTTLAVTGSAASAEVGALGDVEGSFLFRNVALQPGANGVTITGSDALGRMTTASVDVARDDIAPFAAIVDPIDHAWFGASSGPAFSVTGSAIAAPGATIDVAGAPATITSTEMLSSSRTSYSFSANVAFATFGVTPVVARVTEASGASATHAIRLTRLVEAPEVTQVFPENLAVAVDPGAMVVVVFSNPMDRASLVSAFRLETATGSPVAGTTRFDRDAITFAPSAPLGAGEYRIRIAPTASDIGGEPLGTEYTATFRTASDAPSTAPTLDALPARICDSTVTIAGTAPVGVRVRLDLGTLTLTTTADAGGRFTFNAPLSGPSGYQLVQVRSIGIDGTLSPAAHACLLAGCGGLDVVSASFDRAINVLSIAFSGDFDPETATSEAIRLRTTDGTRVVTTISIVGSTATVIPALDLTHQSFTLEVTTAVRATDGTALRAPFTQSFMFTSDEPPAGDGSGFISGQVLDASTGRPLAGAMISLTAPVNAYKSDPSITAMSVSAQAFAGLTDLRGRYTLRLPEGPHTLTLFADGYTTAWRQIIVTAGQGVTPIDIRLTPSGQQVEISGAVTLTHGGDSSATTSASLDIPAGGVTSGTSMTLTSVGAQSLAGLLPLGWSPIASVEISSEGAEAPLNGTLSFNIDGTAVTAAAQVLTLARYDFERDEWRVVTPVVAISGNTASSPITTTGAYALVYPDARAPRPSPLASGSALVGIQDPCAAEPCVLTATSFVLNPEIVLPTQTSVATLAIDGASPFPSGTAVQAWIDEELRLSDGSVLLDPPFAADLILYRSLDGASAAAIFAVAPSPRAAEVILDVGYERLNVLPYPGRLARGTLIGNEGGRIPGDGSVVVEIPAGATPEPVRASSSSLTSDDLAALGSVPGFRILGGFALELERASESPQPDLDGDGVPDTIAVELTASARVTFNIDRAGLPTGAEVVVAEVLDATSYGRVIRLAARATEVVVGGSEAKLLTTRSIDRAVLPLDGVVREGRYLFLAAEQPIAFATGAVRRGATAPYLEGALVAAPPLGIQDLTRVTGLFAIPVLAAPAAPFTLTARHRSMGEGTPYIAATQPEPSSIVAIGDFILVPQPPLIVSTAPAANATGVSLSTTVRVQFDRALDPTSINADTIFVTDSINGARTEGTTSLDGASAILWTPPSVQRPLSPSTRYGVTVDASIRATTGAPLGAPYSFSFSTIEILASTEVHPERIGITIPQNGASTIHGTAGAFPSGWQAVAVRRGKDFIVRYQGTAGSDGSFSFFAGNGTTDRITIADTIDLQVLNTSGTLTAIVPLTPFVSEDGRSFIASPNTPLKIATPDGLSISVPAGAFDQPTLVTVERKQKEVLALVPDLNDEVNWSASIELKFDCTVGGASPPSPCRARERIDVEIPVHDADPAKIHILALLGQSIRGPRLMAVDTLRVSDGKLVTAAEGAGKLSINSASSSSAPASLAPHPSSIAPSNIKLLLLGATHPGVYSAVDVRVPVGTSVGWGVVDGLASGHDLFWDSLDSFYAANFYLVEGRGRIAIPVLKGRRFTITGVDSATGLDVFEKIYNPLPMGDPGAVTTIETPNADTQGPYPIFGTPFRIETLDLTAENIDLSSIRNFVVRLEGGLVTVTDSASPVAASLPVTLLNVGTGKADANRSDGLVVSGSPGDRIALAIGREDVDPDTAISVVFSEPIALDGAVTPHEIDAFLRTKFEVRRILGSTVGTVTPLFRFGIDSSARRISIESRGALHRGATYRLEISKKLADASGLTIGQVVKEGEVKGGLAGGLILEFTTREPRGEIGQFAIVEGSIRDLARSGNTLFVSALDGGLRAFDIANAATPVPLGFVPRVVDDSWAVAVDGHDRVFTTMLGNLFGGLRTYRAEDFRSATSEPPAHIGAGIVSWAPGYQGSLGLAGANVLTDRPEAIPRKLQILSQDADIGPFSREEFKASAGVVVTKIADHPDGFEELSVTVPHDPALPYLVQRVTVENRSAGFRWSADARPGSPATLAYVIARESDDLVLIRNQRTYGVVSLFGHGIGVFDLNAIESNDASEKPEGYKAPRENVLLTSAQLEEAACSHPSPDSGAIRDLALTPEAAILSHEQLAMLRIYALDANRGILDLRVSPWTLAGDALPFCGRAPMGLLFRSKGTTPPDDPRLHAMRAQFEALAKRTPFARFNGISTHRWRIEAADNTPMLPGGKIGQRGTPAGTFAERDYLLVAGNEYGVLVVEAPENDSLAPQFLVDVIWIPAGASSVRAIPGSNLATVVDGEGHLLLVDLARIDQRRDAHGALIDPNALFPILAASLGKNGSYGTGLEDPRIIWRSEEPVASGTLAPLIDPDLGIVIAARLLGKTLRVLSAIDPRFRVMIGVDGILREVSGIVPLGASQ